MSQLAIGKTLGMDFSKAQLHSRITFFFRFANLGNETWPSFDERHRICDALLIEDLGHADLLANQPF